MSSSAVALSVALALAPASSPGAVALQGDAPVSPAPVGRAGAAGPAGPVAPAPPVAPAGPAMPVAPGAPSRVAATPPPSPAPVPSRRYGFAEVIARAQARNPGALTAEQEILRAEALVREARAGSFPTITGNAVGTRLDHARKLADRVLQNDQALSANVTGVLPVLAPQRWVQWSHAADDAGVSRVSARDVRRGLAIAAARSYLAVIAQHRFLDVADRAFATARAHYDFAHRRWVGGLGNRLDEVRAAQEVETTRAQAELARSALVRTQEALGVVLAEDGPVDVTDEVPLPEAPGEDTAVQQAASLRTDIEVLESRATAARHVLRDSYADYLPTLSLQGQYFYQNPSTVTQPETGWQAQLVLSIPLYDGGLRYGARDERAAVSHEAEIALEGALRQVRADVRAAFEALRRADDALAASRRAAALANEALQLASKAYEAGATTNLEVIDAERRARDADAAAAAAEDGARQARLDMLAASGRFP